MVLTKTHLFFLLSASWCAPTNYSDAESGESYEYYEYKHDTNPAAVRDESSDQTHPEQVASDYDDYEYRWELV